MEHVLVAGAAEPLGVHLVETLRRRGHRIRALTAPGFPVPEADETVTFDPEHPERLGPVCAGVDTVVTAFGVTARQGSVAASVRHVHRVNRTLLRRAVEAAVTTFGAISVVRPEAFGGVSLVQARERLLTEVRSAPLAARVVRLTPSFDDMTQFLALAHQGTVWLAGGGTARVNPIAAADAAVVAADALEGDTVEVAAGGPDVLTYRDIAELAVSATGGTARLRRVPAAVLRSLVPPLRLLAPRMYGSISFFSRAFTHDLVAPATGSRHLGDAFAEAAASGEL